ncbi:MAG: FG-GAP repeat domain-containing protein [Planctomycetota bacterium]|jgi:hypothetical protein
MKTFRGVESRLGVAAAVMGAMIATPDAPGQTSFDFAPPVIYELGFNGYPRSVDAGDLDEDGFVDLVLSGHNSDGVVIFLFGGPGGGFEPPVLLEMGGHTSWTAVRDLNGDDHLDLIISHRRGLGRVSVILGNGTRAFPAPTDYPAGRDPNLVRVADLNGDEIPDLAVLNWQTYDISILIGDGFGGFTLAQSVAVNRTASAGSSPVWAEVVDIDGDLDLDIATVGLNANGAAHLLLNRGDGTFVPAIQQTVAGIDDDEGMATLTAADFDGDGDVDLVTKAGGIDFADRIIVLANDGAGRFVSVTVVPLFTSLGGSPWDIACGDFDGDENVDLAWVSHILSTQAVGFLRNNGDGIPTFASPEQRFVLGAFPRALLPSDLDGDGDLDLAVANLGNHTVAVLRNLTAEGSFADSVRGFAESGVPASDGPQRAVGFACGDPAAGDCFEPHPEPACDDLACCEAVCAQVPLCCLAPWDEICVAVARDICEEPPACPGESSCFEPHEESGCDDQVCCELICLIDPFCCDGPWDRRCADEAGQLCDVPACELADCPPEATPEPETIDCWDRTNDGCNIAPPAFTPIACGEVVCGTTWTSGGRDTDWYEISVDERSELTWTVSSEFPSELFIVSGRCDERFTTAASAFGGNCQAATAGLVVDPGTYYLYVAPGTTRAAISNGIGCLEEGEPVNGGAYGGRYLATAACEPTCPQDIDGDGIVGTVEFLRMLAAWGQSPGGPPDFDGDGIVGMGDFIALIAAWGDCP